MPCLLASHVGAQTSWSSTPLSQFSDASFVNRMALTLLRRHYERWSDDIASVDRWSQDLDTFVRTLDKTDVGPTEVPVDLVHLNYECARSPPVGGSSSLLALFHGHLVGFCTP
eukprot:3908168-Amphidinium_carterae.1